MCVMSLIDMIDAACVDLSKETDVANWYDYLVQSDLVKKIQKIAKDYNLVDRYNFNMDMLSRSDLCIVS